MFLSLALYMLVILVGNLAGFSPCMFQAVLQLAIDAMMSFVSG
jgi:hypothetical protein